MMPRLTKLVLTCLAVTYGLGQAERLSGESWPSNLNPSRILFLGNSITNHDPNSARAWYGSWGMAASAQNKDYVHVLTDAIAQSSGIQTTINFTTSLVSFERNWDEEGFDINALLQPVLTFNPTIVVVAIGENVTYPSSWSEVDAYRDACRNMLDILKENGHPAIFSRSSFWPDSPMDGAMRDAALDVGGSFIDISSLCENPAYFAWNEPYADPSWKQGQANEAVGHHPGDTGMQAIADAIFGSMLAYPAPEPGTLGLAIIGSIGLLSYAWRKRK